MCGAFRVYVACGALRVYVACCVWCVVLCARVSVYVLYVLYVGCVPYAVCGIVCVRKVMERCDTVSRCNVIPVCVGYAYCEPMKVKQ